VNEVTTDAQLAQLSSTFTYTDARRAGLSDRRLRSLRNDGRIDQIGRGLYRRLDTDAADTDPDLLEITRRAPASTLCLATALARHNLIDLIPTRTDIALPRGQRHPRTTAPVTWHSFAADTFTIGREHLELTPQDSIGLYSPERCLIDAFRLRHREGADIAIEALRRWLRQPGSTPAALIMMTRSFPTAEPSLRTALEILL
jgi:predicted transcriptional regulator of viral defense system